MVTCKWHALTKMRCQMRPSQFTSQRTKLNWMPDDFRVMLHDSPTRSGSSGGPVLDASGHIVGVTHKGGGAVSAAIKLHLLKAFLESNNVEYKTASSTKNLSLSAIEKQSEKSTVITNCLY